MLFLTETICSYSKNKSQNEKPGVAGKAPQRRLKMNNNERRFKYYDMSEEGFKNNEQLRSEPIIKIFDDPAYTLRENGWGDIMMVSEGPL